MTKHIFNPALPLLGERLVDPTASDLADVRCFKYADFEYVRKFCENAYVRYVLEHMPIMNNHKRVLIDVKVHDLRVEEVACVPGWHLDGSVNPKKLSKQGEVLTLFVSGQHALTEFLACPIECDVKDTWDFAMMSRACSTKIPADHPTWSIPSCQFGTYNDHYFHRGKPATGKERRLLVRTTETDIIEPKNCIYTPYTHKVGDELPV